MLIPIMLLSTTMHGRALLCVRITRHDVIIRKLPPHSILPRWGVTLRGHRSTSVSQIIIKHPLISMKSVVEEVQIGKRWHGRRSARGVWAVVIDAGE